MMENPYFKIVETPEEMEIFKKIWLEVCHEMTFETEDFHTRQTGMHFLIKNEEGDYVGTVEIGKYLNNDKSTVQYYHDFSKIDKVAKEMNHTYEGDKACIYPKYRSSGLIYNMIYIMMFHHFITGSVYYIGAMEWKFNKAMKRFYKVPIEEIGERQKFNDFYLQPTMLNIKDYINQLIENNNVNLDFDYLHQLVNSYQEGQIHETFSTK